MTATHHLRRLQTTKASPAGLPSHRCEGSTTIRASRACGVSFTGAIEEGQGLRMMGCWYCICGQASACKNGEILPSRILPPVPPLLPQGQEPQAHCKNPQNHTNHQRNAYPPETMRDHQHHKITNNGQRPPTQSPTSRMRGHAGPPMSQTIR